MPLTVEVRRLGRSWDGLKDRVTEYAKSIPHQGISLVEFERECLAEVFVPDRPAIVQALKSARIIWTARTGTTWRVYGSKPAAVGRPAKDDPSADTFLRAIAPLMAQLAATVDATDGFGDREGRARQGEAVRQIVAVARRHLARGKSLADMRASLWLTFRAEVVEALAHRETLFDRQATVEAVEAPRKQRTRLPSGLAPDARVLALVAKAGARGILRKEIANGFPAPRPSSAEVSAVLEQAEADGIIRSAVVKLSRMGRPGRRFYAAEHPLPRMVNGTAVFAP